MKFKSILVAAGVLAASLNFQAQAATINFGTFSIDESQFATAGTAIRGGVGGVNDGDPLANSVGSSLSTFDFSATFTTYEYTFANSLVNGAGIDLLIFETALGTATRPTATGGKRLVIDGQTFDLNLRGLIGTNAVPFETFRDGTGPFQPGTVFAYGLDFSNLGIADGGTIGNSLRVSDIASSQSGIGGIAGIAGINQSISAVLIPAALPMLVTAIGVFGLISMRRRQSA